MTVLQDPVPTLSRITAPVLLLWGEQDAMIPFGNSADYQRVLPDSQLISLPGVGHLVQEEAPDRSVQALRAFLAKPAPAPSEPQPFHVVEHRGKVGTGLVGGFHVPELDGP